MAWHGSSTFRPTSRKNCSKRCILFNPQSGHLKVSDKTRESSPGHSRKTTSKRLAGFDDAWTRADPWQMLLRSARRPNAPQRPVSALTSSCVVTIAWAYVGPLISWAARIASSENAAVASFTSVTW